MKESTESANVPVIVPQGAILPDVLPVTDSNSCEQLSLHCNCFVMEKTYTDEWHGNRCKTRKLTSATVAIEKLNAGAVTSHVRLPRVCTKVVLQRHKYLSACRQHSK